MGLLSEKYNYVKGLCDGLEISNETKEGKVILALMELLDDVVLSVEDLEDSRDEMNEFLDEIDEDLADLEEAVYEEEEDCDCGCDCDDDGVIGEVECPECKELIELSGDMFNDECTAFTCPNCGEEVEVDWECDCDCDDDECDCEDCE